MSPAGEHPRLISPEGLSDDLMKWQESLDPKFVEKAKQNSKFGWVVGRELEVIPRSRRPHCAYLWVGIGAIDPPSSECGRGASCVREVVTTIPAGYGGDVEDADAALRGFRRRGRGGGKQGGGGARPIICWIY